MLHSLKAIMKKTGRQGVHHPLE